MEHFIFQDDKKTVGNVLRGIELANRKDDKIFNEWMLHRYRE